MKEIDQAIVDYLENYGQPQTYEAIAEYLAGSGFEDYSREDVEALVKAKEIEHADGGVDYRGEPVTLYAPVA